MNKTALITGICGQDGSYLAEYLISKHGRNNLEEVFLKIAREKNEN